MTDSKHNEEITPSPYKKGKTANLFSIAIGIVATAIKNFVLYTLLRKSKENRDSELYRATLRTLQQQHPQRLAEIESHREQVAKRSWLVRKIILPTIALIVGLLTLAGIGITVLHFILTLKIDLQLLGMLIPVYFWAVMIAAVIIVKTYADAYNQYNVRYRQLFIPALAESFGEVRYQQYGYIDLARLKNSMILPDHDLIYQEDYFSGSHRGCAFELVEAELYKRDHGRQRNNKRFSGLILSIDLPVSFNSTTLVRKNSVLLNVQRKTPMRFKRVHLEDSQFQKTFTVHSTDQILARSWLTPAVMQRLQQLANVFNCIDFQASLYQDKLLVLLNTSQDFLPPPPIAVPLSDGAAGYEFVVEVSAMYALIEALLAQFAHTSQP